MKSLFFLDINVITTYIIFLLVFLAIITSGCQHIGFNESYPLFVGRYTEYILGNRQSQNTHSINPLPVSKENISDGKKIYQTQCMMCHGALGEGNGPAGLLLVPHPANLSVTRRLPIATDAFLFWTLSEGGVLLETAMPAFSERLSNEEIWKTILYINSGFTI